MPLIKPGDYFDLTKTQHASIYDGLEMVWQAIPRIQQYLRERLRPGVEGEVAPGAFVGPDVYVGPGTVIEHGAVIKGPVLIGRDCDIRPGAYIRDFALIGNGCVVGNSCEIKNSLLHDEANVPHLSYVGDSLLGWRAHLGAGVKLSNVRLSGESVIVLLDGRRYNTGLRKLGAVLGDQVEIGCNSVLNPGSLIGPRSVIYPGTVWNGSLGADRIVKLRQTHQEVERTKRDS
jgi:NDP-sugar pyrophosphorylase family protein